MLGSVIASVAGSLGSYGASRLMNRHLTGKEREQNAFNAQQAQMNRDYQTEMSNTAYQRAVSDMQNAGLNPALMYGNGSAASTPTGSNASGSASLFDSPVGIENLVQAYATMKSVKADVDLKRSQERLNDAKADESRVSASKIVEETLNIKETRKQIVASVEGLDLDNQQKSIIIKYADDVEQAKLANLKKDVEVKDKEVEKFNAEISRLNEDTKRVAQETMVLVEQVNLMMSQQSLNRAQAGECLAKIGEINQNIDILKKDNSHYDWNHMKTLSFKDGVAVTSNADGTYNGSFTGASAAIRGAGKENRRKKRES